MKQSLGLIAMMAAAVAAGGTTFKMDPHNLPTASKNTGSHHAKSSHKQNRRKEIARRRA